MSIGRRLRVAGLMVEAAALALLEVLFLPLRFDGYLLPDWGGFPFPATVLVAAVTTPRLVAAAGRLAPKLSVAGAPLLAWLVAVGALAVGGPGGDMVLVPDWRALLLLLAGALPAAMVLGRVLAEANAEAQRRVSDPVGPGRPAGA